MHTRNEYISDINLLWSPGEGSCLVPSSSIRYELLSVQNSSSFLSPSTGCSDAGGPPPGGAVSLQGLWLCWPHSSGL